MSKMFKFVSMGLMLVLVSGCSWFRVVVPGETVYVYEKYHIPQMLMEYCVLDKPVDNDSYMVLSLSERERELTEYIIRTFGKVDKCNIRMRELRNYVKEKEEFFDSKNVNKEAK